MTYTKENKAEAIYSNIQRAVTQARDRKIQVKNITLAVIDEIIKSHSRGYPTSFWVEVLKEIEKR